jgi:hypothetical protein
VSTSLQHTARPPVAPKRHLPRDAARPRALPARRALRDESPAPPPPSPERDRGLSLLWIFLVAALIIVGAVVLANAVDSWWILIPVMAVDLLMTFGVLAGLMRLLADDGRR